MRCGWDILGYHFCDSITVFMILPIRDVEEGVRRYWFVSYAWPTEGNDNFLFSIERKHYRNC